jgi:hypothetical protein
MSREYEATEEEMDKIGREGIKAALSELNKLDMDEEDYYKNGIVICVNAFDAARSAMLKEEENLLFEKGEFDELSCVYASVDDVVFSAMACHLMGINEDVIDEINYSPRSKGGVKLLVLFKSMVAMEAMATARDVITEDFGFLSSDQCHEVLSFMIRLHGQ